MATVESNGKITIMKYNNCDAVDIQIDDGNGIVELSDDDVRFLANLLKEWLDEDD